LFFYLSTDKKLERFDRLDELLSRELKSFFENIRMNKIIMTKRITIKTITPINNLCEDQNVSLPYIEGIIIEDSSND
jgi:hypothetical protein